MTVEAIARILRFTLIGAARHGRKLDAITALLCFAGTMVVGSVGLALTGLFFALAAWLDLTSRLVRGRIGAEGR